MTEKASQTKEGTWRNRIVGYGEEDPGMLVANPKNWRVHPKVQQDALNGVLRDVGVVQNIIVNRTTGHVVDGHLRVALAIREKHPSIPVTYLELSEAEEAEVLATLDPLSAMAATDKDQLDALLRDVSTADANVMSMLASLGERKSLDRSVLLSDIFELVVACSDEDDLHMQFSRMTEEGRSCRTLMLAKSKRPIEHGRSADMDLPGHVEIIRRSDVPESWRTARVKGLFDLPSATSREFRLSMDLDLSGSDWGIGVITGASGSGKSQLARELYGNVIEPESMRWSASSILDDFREDLSVDEITSALTAVGFSSTPNWLCPYSVLSLGERFRVVVARALVEADADHPLVIDEFTSVVDRIVAKVCATAIAKAVRLRSQRMVAVTCHRDVIPWLNPDWVIDLDTRRCLPRSIESRPSIILRLYPAQRDAWGMFRHAHYLSGDLHKSSQCWVASVELDDRIERMAAFLAYLPALGMAGWKRQHRVVVLPDFQGIGVGSQLQDMAAERVWEQDHRRVRATGSSPAMISHRRGHPEAWKLVSKPQIVKRSYSALNGPRGVRNSAGRLTTSWEYIPQSLRESESQSDQVDAGQILVGV